MRARDCSDPISNILLEPGPLILGSADSRSDRASGGAEVRFKREVKAFGREDGEGFQGPAQREG